MEDRIVKYILLILSALVFIGLIINCIPTFLWTDDYSFASSLDRYGVFEFVWKMYNGWDGRHLTPSGLTQAFLIKYSNAPFTTFIWVICYILAFVFLSKQLVRSNCATMTALLCSSFLIIFQSHLFQTLYWSVGGLYSMILLIGAVWLYYYKRENHNVFLLYSLSFVAGATSQNFSISLLSIVAIDLMIEYKKRRILNTQWMIALVFLFFGTLFITFAPGNSARAGVVVEDWSVISKLEMMLNNYINGLILTKPIYFLAPLFGLISYPIKKENRNNLSDGVKYIIAAFASLAPFILLPAMMSAEARTTIFFQFFIFIGILHFSWHLISVAEQKFRIFWNKAIIVSRLASITQIMILATSVYLLVANYEAGMEIKKQYIAREELIKDSKKKCIVVEGIAFKGNRRTFMHYFYDINTDSTHNFNRMAASYYQLESIRVIKNRAFEN